MTDALKPCPFCGAGLTSIRENGRMWTGQRYSAPTSVSVQHHCEPTEGQPSRMIERVGRDEASAIEAWNRRALSAPAAPSVPRERFDALLAQEHALSDAYVRLRQIIGAMDPPTVSDAPALWAYVEQVARERMAAAP